MIRDIELAFIKLHILYHAGKEEIFGIGMIEELAEHGYDLSPGTLYPTLAKMEDLGWLTCENRTVEGKQRKYYQIAPEGEKALGEMKRKIEELYREIIKGH